MKKRLDEIYQRIQNGIGICDVGTDHGQIPIELATAGYLGNIIASDIHPGPLQAAYEHARSVGVEKRIWFYCCDGIPSEALDKIDTVVIAGMGGDTITGILDRAEWIYDLGCLFLLQPMTKAEILRYWLINNGFDIIEESVTEESGRLYQLLVCRYTGRHFSISDDNDAELLVGKRVLHKTAELYERLIEHRCENIQNLLINRKSAVQLTSSSEEQSYRNLLAQLQNL